ncbi:MAG TPA: SHOCT domain-containing protein [Solirubrobacterales bacterium]
MSLLLSVIPLADWHGPGWWVVFFPLGWFVFFFAVFFLFRQAGWWGCAWGDGARYGRRSRGGPGDDPVEILGRRFAEGQIDAEEYAARRSALERRD